jgi:hypothetical protein
MRIFASSDFALVIGMAVDGIGVIPLAVAQDELTIRRLVSLTMEPKLVPCALPQVSPEPRSADWLQQLRTSWAVWRRSHKRRLIDGNCDIRLSIQYLSNGIEHMHS